MPTSTIKVNEKNDLYLADGQNLLIIHDLEACTQDVRLQTLMAKGENIYDVEDGVDYFGAIFGPQRNYDDARRSIINAITRSPDVISVESLDIGVRGEVFTYEALTLTTHGIARVSNEVTQ